MIHPSTIGRTYLLPTIYGLKNILLIYPKKARHSAASRQVKNQTLAKARKITKRNPKVNLQKFLLKSDML